MFVPKGMKEDEVVDLIIIICNRIAPKYTFYGYTVDDMKQEAFIICMQALEKYDPEYPLENFLSFILPGRLINVIRNNHFIKDSKEEKKKVAMPGQLSNEESTHYYESSMLEDMEVYELFKIVDDKISYEHRDSYLKILNGVSVDKKSKEEVMQAIQDIAKEAGYYED